MAASNKCLAQNNKSRHVSDATKKHGAIRAKNKKGLSNVVISMAITAAKKAPNPTDRHVGSRVRMRRKMLAMSQTQLADALGITYQQVQKNERGTNRIGASRWQQISHILQVPIAFFFEGASNASASRGPHGSELSIAQIDDFVSDPNGLRLIGAFMRIDNAELRRRIVMLVQEIAGDDERPA